MSCLANWILALAEGSSKGPFLGPQGQQSWVVQQKMWGLSAGFGCLLLYHGGMLHGEGAATHPLTIPLLNSWLCAEEAAPDGSVHDNG